jgi:hypothetical protein
MDAMQLQTTSQKITFNSQDQSAPGSDSPLKAWGAGSVSKSKSESEENDGKCIAPNSTCSESVFYLYFSPLPCISYCPQPTQIDLCYETLSRYSLYMLKLNYTIHSIG